MSHPIPDDLVKNPLDRHFDESRGLSRQGRDGNKQFGLLPE
jgi:hypothetical protein